MTSSRRGSADETEAVRYQLPRTTGTVWLGLRMSSLLTLALALAVTVLLVLAGGSVPAAVTLFLLAAVVALVPIADRPALHWVGPVVGHHLHAGRHAWSTPDQLLPRETHRGQQSRVPLPPECGRIVAATVESGEDRKSLAGDNAVGGATAVLVHKARSRRDAADTGSELLPRGAQTVVLEVRAASGFGLLDGVNQDTTLAEWGSNLDALAADTRVLRVQWLTHTRPAQMTSLGNEPQPHHAALEVLGHADPEPNDACRFDLEQDYDALVAGVAAQAWAHTHLLAVTLRPDGSARPDRRGRGSTVGNQHAPESGLLEQVRDITGLLLFADLLARPLGRAELGRTLRVLTEPDFAGDVVGDFVGDSVGDPDGRAGGDDGEGDGAWGVRCRRTEWTAVRTGDAWHRSYAVSNWPNLPLPADWLAGILASPPPDGTSRTLAVHARPISPVHAVRQARAAAAKVQLDAADRSRFGLTGAPGGATPLDDQRATDAAALETELAAGYRMLHTRALITISATSPHRLQQATSTLRATAATHRLDLRPLHGQHHLGLVATLPLTVVPGSRS